MPYLTLAGGAELFYREWGEGDHIALFIHPIMHDGTLWLDQLESLGSRCRCVAVDLRGHGKSDPSPKREMDLTDHVKDLVYLVDHLGNAPIEQRPERMRSLTMISSFFSAGEVDPAQKRYTAELGRLSVLEDKGVVFRRWLEYIMAPDADLHAKARYRSMLDRTPVETLVAFLANVKLDPRPDLPGKLNLPVFMPVGGNDPIVKLDGPMSEIPNLTTKNIPTAGRLLPLEAPDELTKALVEFWDSLG